ncbi:MAG TPA: helix-turn-helix domain-containing protein [Solirubrobacter sp.]|nr:helix-turn-helix domain-containing protein [Solirubrobacter sp.]
MPGLRERKKRETRAAIRDAAMKLFAEQGFAATTIDQIAEAANVSRATVFGYYGTKEEIVFGDAGAAIEWIRARLAERAPGETTIAVVRAWLDELTGWLEPELILQQQLAREVPVVGARRLQIYGDIEEAIAESMKAELGPECSLAASLAAAALVAGLRVAEETAAARMEREDRALTREETAALLDRAVAFAQAGIEAISSK